MLKVLEVLECEGLGVMSYMGLEISLGLKLRLCVCARMKASEELGGGMRKKEANTIVFMGLNFESDNNYIFIQVNEQQ